MTIRFLWNVTRLLVEFFAWETIWGATSMLKAIYYGRLVLICLPLVAAILMVDSIGSWPSSRQADGEESLVLQREFKAAQERDKEMQQELRADSLTMAREIRDLQLRQIKSEEFQKRIEEKFDTGMKVLWAMCSLLIVQVIIPLLKLGLRRELSRIKLVPDED